MPVIATDRRRLEVGKAPGSEGLFWAGITRLREGEVQAARALAELDAARSFLRHGCSSAVDWAVRGGVRRKLARRLLRIGRVLAAAPGAGDELRSGELDPEAVAEIGRVVDPPGAPARDSASASGDEATAGGAESGAAEAGAARSPGVGARPTDLRDWLDRSKTLPDRALRRDVREHLEGRAQGEQVVPMAFAVAESVRDDFRRARTVASRKAQTPLTDGQALAVVTREYLARNDPLRTERRARRVGPTSQRPEDRYIPAQVRAAVLARSGDRCEFPGCGYRTFLQFAHVVWHRDDGDRETENLLRLCTTHHTLLDAGCIRFLGFGEVSPDTMPQRDDGRRRSADPEFLVVATGELVTRELVTGELVTGAARARSAPEAPQETFPETTSGALGEGPPRAERRQGGVRERAPPYGHGSRSGASRARSSSSWTGRQVDPALDTYRPSHGRLNSPAFPLHFPPGSR